MNTNDEIYKVLLNVLDNHKPLLNESFYSSMQTKILDEMFLLEIENLFQISIPVRERQKKDYFNFDDYRGIYLFGEKSRRSVSWSDDDRQPEDEWLYMIGFSTGAYSLNHEYPEKTFQEFFNELKRFNPKYIDTVNRNLYFHPENASFVHEVFPTLIKRYRDMAEEEIKQKKIEELQRELKELEK